MNQVEFLRQWFPRWRGNHDADWVLWEGTPYPCGAPTEMLDKYRAAVGNVRKRGWRRKFWRAFVAQHREWNVEIQEMADSESAQSPPLQDWTEAEIQAQADEVRAWITGPEPQSPTWRAIAAMLADLAALKGQTCEWKADEDGIYQTGCGHTFFFDTDGPVENQQKFCGYCGATLKAEPWVHS